MLLGWLGCCFGSRRRTASFHPGLKRLNLLLAFGAVGQRFQVDQKIVKVVLSQLRQVGPELREKKIRLAVSSDEKILVDSPVEHHCGSHVPVTETLPGPGVTFAAQLPEQVP